MSKAAWDPRVVSSPGLVLLAIAVSIVTAPVRPAAQAPAASAKIPEGVATFFTRDVAPILQKHCQVCHRPGMMAPMSLLTFDDSRPWASSIKQRVAAREMPPWHIDRNIGIQKFKGDPSLSDAEIATIVKWVDAGAPKGDPADMPPPRHFEDADVWHIGKPDLIVSLPEEHTVPAHGADAFFKPIADSGLTEDRYIKAVETKPGTHLAVHHALAYMIADPHHPEDATTDSFLNEYAVGKNGDIFPEGSGRLMKAGTKIRFDLHYHSYGVQIHDRVQLGLVFYPKGYVPKHVQNAKALAASVDLDIPAGDPNARTDGYQPMPSAVRITAYQPHMHNRGKAQCLEAIYPDARVETLNCVRFQQGWHIVYNYADEVAPLLPARTILHLISWYDNSPANKLISDPRNWVGYGQRAIDEMSFAWISWYDMTDQEYEREVAARARGEKVTTTGVGSQFSSAGLFPAKYDSGANVVPEFDGWERNPDGTFNMVFGYMNRNYVEEPIVPIGPDNNVEPGGPDQGQPAYFYSRLRRFVFRVKVPKDFGSKDLVWTLTLHGRTDKAYATLAPDLEIDKKIIVENTVLVGIEQVDRNQPPSLEVDPIPPATPGKTVTLIASATDDGLPTLAASSGLLSVAWIVYRGPGKVTFNPPGYERITNPGTARTTARFSEPGRYVLRAMAFDGMLRTNQDVAVDVSGPLK